MRCPRLRPAGEQLGDGSDKRRVDAWRQAYTWSHGSPIGLDASSWLHGALAYRAAGRRRHLCRRGQQFVRR
jgi:hypothetical protein